VDEELSGDTLIGKHYHPLVSPNGIAIEIHRCFGALNAMLPPVEVLRHAVAVEVNGVSVSTPSKEHLLAHHVLHAQERRRDQLWPAPRHIAELAVLIDAGNTDINWSQLLERLSYRGRVGALRRISRSARDLLEAVRSGQSIFSIRGTTGNRHDRFLRRFPNARYADPAYLYDMWFADKLERLGARLATRRGAALLCRRIASRKFWSRAAAELRSV
jgi:hypothetical protein